MKSMRPTLYGNRHAVSAGHYLAAAAGFSILEAGGNAVGWPPQARGDRGMDWRQALTRHIGHVLFGLVALCALGAIVPEYVPWILPVVTGLILSIPIAVLTSRRDVGLAARRIGVFVTPEELRPTKT